MNPILQIENISKRFRISHELQPYLSLREQVGQLFSGKKSKRTEEFWALKDISFNVNAGESVGIIGKNGAGKSTLLKILSKITPPTSGKIISRGRIASLLEVGTGFHPELSGRENIFLNGSILGMKRIEIQDKFDEIVEFSSVAKFLDTPLKHYSSGMQLRLAFAVAAFLEPEILIIDEVLAVGDTEFQKKCMGKMDEVSKSGRTILFVSHNMAAIQNLCLKCIFLRSGSLVRAGTTDQIVSQYLQPSTANHSIELANRKDRSGNGAIRFVSVTLKDEAGNQVDLLQSGKSGSLNLNFNITSSSELNNFHVSVGVDDQNGHRITIFSNEVTNQQFNQVKGESGTVEIALSKIPFRAGLYTFTIYSKVNNEVTDWIQNAGSFHVEAGDYYATGKLPPAGQGNFFIDHHFRLINQ